MHKEKFNQELEISDLTKKEFIRKYLLDNYGFKIPPDGIIPDEFLQKIIKDQVPENFCCFPFLHLQIDPDGRARPCCKYKVGMGWENNVPRLPQYSLEELWNQPELVELREQFLRNERPEGCRACWDEEKAGIKSMRQSNEDGGKEFAYSTFYYHIPRKTPRSLDLKLSNLCNLKCRICNPFCSSQWIKEFKDLNLTDKSYLDLYQNNSKEKLFTDNRNYEILKSWALEIENIEFYGGEPLLQQEHDAVLQLITEHGDPSKTLLFYNTNTTIVKEDFFKNWSKFNKVSINLSVDDLFDRFEYQRQNAKWEETLKNIELFKQYRDKYNCNMELKIYCTIGILNIWYLDEFVEYVKNHIKLPLFFNMVHFPSHYSIVNLSNDIKDQIKNKLEKIDLTDIEMFVFSPTINEIIKYMYDRNVDEIEVAKFWKAVNQHDAYRKQSFKDTFPEFYRVLTNEQNG